MPGLCAICGRFTLRPSEMMGRARGGFGTVPVCRSDSRRINDRFEAWRASLNAGVRDGIYPMTYGEKM